jgi:aspartyl-tRNA(Asn)/glutamyl-tRNA(Gln) amidotransferase subunit C
MKKDKNSIKIDIETVKKTAKLANLSLGRQQSVLFVSQLKHIIDYVEQLNEINTDNVEPTSQVTGLINVWRQDKVTESLSQQQALSNAKSTANGRFKVKAILEE